MFETAFREREGGTELEGMSDRTVRTVIVPRHQRRRGSEGGGDRTSGRGMDRDLVHRVVVYTFDNVNLVLKA